MFDAFGIFANGIISHEASNQGGGGNGGGMYYRAPQTRREDEQEPELRLRKDSLKLTVPQIQITMYRPEGQASGKAFQAATRAH